MPIVLIEFFREARWRSLHQHKNPEGTNLKAVFIWGAGIAGCFIHGVLKIGEGDDVKYLNKTGKRIF